MATKTVPQTEVKKDTFEAFAEQLWELHAMLGEAIAVVQCRLQSLGNEVAYGARDLLSACADQMEKAITAKSEDRAEDVSAPLGVALAVLHVVVDKTDDKVIWAAIRIAESVKEKWDDAIQNLPVEA